MVPGKHQRIEIHFGTESGLHVFETSIKINATLTYVYHAAIAMTLRDFQLRTRGARISRYIKYALVDETRKCEDKYRAAEHAAAVYHSISGESIALDLLIPSEDHEYDQAREREEFLALMGQIRQYYHAMRKNHENIFWHWLYGRCDSRPCKSSLFA